MSELIDDPHLRHLFDGNPINVYSTDVTNLSAGTPGPDILKLCIDLFTEATLHRMKKERENAYLFQYGIPSGLWDYREELAKFLSKQYGDSVQRKHLFLTCGASHGLQLVMGAFLCPNAIIFVEEVTFMIALEAFKQYPLMKVVPVPMTADGVDVVALQKIATREKSKQDWILTEQRPFWAMFYTIPVFHNPTGVTMSSKTCEAVVQVARNLNFVVLCEDVYNLLYYGTGFPPKRLIAYDVEGFKGGHVISNGTFSKILAPGVRVGWLELPSRLISSLKSSGILLSGGSCNHYMSGVITSLLQLGLQEKHLMFLKVTLQARMTGLCDTLNEYLPEGCTFRRPEGGYFVWIKLPEHINALDFNTWCQKKYQVAAYPGQKFSAEGNYKNYLRIGIAFHSKEIVEEAAEKLCSGLSKYMLEIVMR